MLNRFLPPRCHHLSEDWLAHIPLLLLLLLRLDTFRIELETL